VPEQNLGAGPFIAARNFPEIPDVPNWTSLSPRFGATYDLFGNGRTALKASWGLYQVGDGTRDFTRNINPVTTTVSSANRPWTDANGDFIPQESELGPLSDAAFGQLRVRTRYTDDVREGFNIRQNNWAGSVGVQHEVRPGLGASASYFYRSYGNQQVTDNLLVGPQDYDQYCITAPTDSRLGNVSGSQICGLTDIKPAKFGQFDTVIDTIQNFDGRVKETFNGFDFTVNARFPNGASLSGGTATGKSTFDSCDLAAQDLGANILGSDVGLAVSGVIMPGSTRFCHQESPFLTQVKLFGVYPLPWAFQFSATYQNVPGPDIQATYVATNAEIVPSLGRNLSGGARNVTIHLIQPGSRYDSRRSQLDARLTRTFRFGRYRVQGMVDFYNLFNGNDTIRLNTRYGPDWLKPQQILTARMIKLGAQLDF
jgi:hypothetical protein